MALRLRNYGCAKIGGKKALPHKYNNKEKSWLYERKAGDLARSRFSHRLGSDVFSACRITFKWVVAGQGGC